MIDILERPEIRRRGAPLSLEGYHVLRDLGLVPVKSELLNGVVVEIAVTSADLDRAKADLYAAAGIPAYWLILGRDGAVEVHSSPVDGRYSHIRRVTQPETLTTWYGTEIQYRQRACGRPLTRLGWKKHSGVSRASPFSASSNGRPSAIPGACGLGISRPRARAVP